MAVYKFLNKPWDDAVIRDKVDEAFGYYEARNGRAGNNELRGVDLRPGVRHSP